MSNKYFYVHNGLTVGVLSVDAASGNLTTQGVFTTTNSTNATTSTLGTSAGALQVAGGAGIVQDLWVGGKIYSGGAQVLTNQGGAFVASLSAGTDTAVSSTTGNVTVYSTATFATVTGRSGAGYAAGVTPNLISITNTAQSVTTNSGQALLVTGGIGANIGVFGTVKTLDAVNASTFAGPVTFGGNVTFNGSATYVYSTQTAYTDNLLEIHVPPGGVNSQWTSNDGKDIGFRFHYYSNSTDTNAALILDQTAGSLEWYSSGAESTTSVFTSATYGIFKTGGIILTNTTTNNGNATSGALQIAGGVGIGGSLWVANTLTAANFVGTFQGNSTTANNLNNGKNGEMPIQNGAGSTTFIPAGTNGYLLQYNNASSATWVTTSTMIVGNANAVLNTPTSSAGTYYVQVVGANSASYQTPGTVSTVSIDPSTGYLTATRFVGSGAGLTNTTVPNSALVNSSITVTAGTGLNGGGTVALGSTVTLGNNGVTSFSGGTTGLTPATATTGSVTLAGTLALASGGTSATLVASPGSVVYGTASAMAFNTAGTAGQLLVSGGTGAPTFTGTATIRVGFADTATYSTNLLGGALGSIPYQTAAGTTAFLPIGSSGYVLAVGAGSTATWTALGSLSSGLSNTATNIQYGSAGQIPIQTAPGFTSFIPAGTVGQILQYQSPNTATFVTTTTVRVGFADTATNVLGGSVNATIGAFSGVTTVTNTTGASSTITGALQVAGGVGIGGGMYVAGVSTFTGNIVTSNVPIVYDQTGVSVGNTAVTIDTFAVATYRSAKYVLTISNAGNAAYQSTELLVIHDGITPYLQDVSVFTGAAPIMTFTVTTGTGNVLLQGTGTATGNTVKVQKIYTTV